jgi:hypothetical protein
MERYCPKCQNTTKAEGVSVDVLQFACPHCRSLISYERGAEGRVEKQFDEPTVKPVFQVGQKGTFDGIEYTVTGIVVKQVQKFYYWREYILTAEKDEQLYLSETDGHWILLRKIDDQYDVQGYPEEYTYDDMVLKIYDYDDPKTFMAEGFFDYDVTPKRQRMIEYINPPYIYSVEETDNNEKSVYFGEHISSRKVKKAFSANNLPSSIGVGIVQPFAINLRYMGIIFSAMAIQILVSHIFIYMDRTSTPVLSESLSFYEYSGKDFVSKPFTLEGGSAPMAVKVSSNVDNSWAAVQVALVNENTKEEVYASKDIEYYHGYDGGESWSEGSTSETFNICGVSEGRYHFVVTPQRAPDNTTPGVLQISASWNQPTAWNMIIPIAIMLILFVAVYFFRAYFNQRRWADSSYSPYHTND